MSVDPYDDVASEVRQALSSASSLHAAFVRLSKGRPGEAELRWSRDEVRPSVRLPAYSAQLRAALSSLESDSEELEETIRIVESGGPRAFGIDDRELDRRKMFVKSVREDISRMQYDLTAASATSSRRPNHSSSQEPYRDDPEDQADPDADLERQQQSMLYEEQDRTLTSIGGVITTLRSQATVMGREVFEQVGLIQDISNDVDRTDSRLATANQRMQRFIDENRNSKSSWCILILIIVLFILVRANAAAPIDLGSSF